MPAEVQQVRCQDESGITRYNIPTEVNSYNKERRLLAQWIRIVHTSTKRSSKKRMRATDEGFEYRLDETAVVRHRVLGL